MIRLCVLYWVFAKILADSSPDIELAGFADLYQLARQEGGEKERQDRSLANTFPFNTSPDTNRRRSRQRQPSRSRQRQRDQSPGADVLAARASYVQDYLGSSVSPRLGLLPPSSSSNSQSPEEPSASTFQINPQSQSGGPASTFQLNQQSQIGGPASPFQPNPQSGGPASTFQLNPQLSNPLNEGFTLLAGLGTQPESKNPYSAVIQEPVQNQYQAVIQEPVQNLNLGTPKTPAEPIFSNNIASSLPTGLSQSNPSFSGFPNFPASTLKSGNNDIQSLSQEFDLQDLNQNIAVPAINVVNDPFVFPKANPTRQPASRPTPAFFVPSRKAITRRPSQAVRKPIRQLIPTRRPAIRFENPNRRRNPAQRRRKPTGQNFAAVAAAGQKCIDKIEEVEEIEYDEVEECDHSYDRKCHTSYSTEFESQQEEECSKWPKEVCTVGRELKTKFNPVTKCEKVPQELCGPVGCGFVPGPEECHDDVRTVVTDVPSEVCDLQPQRKCAHVTKLVPKLTPVEECVDVPKEVCQRKKGNPRTVFKPVTKTWCYTPTEESGLA